MLTPDYLQGCTADIVATYQELNETITKDIARRIIKTGRVTETAKWQAKQAQEAGKLLDDIIKDVAAISGRSNKEIAELFSEAGVASVAYDAAPLIAAGFQVETGLSPAMMQVLEANLRKTQRNMGNLSMTTASIGQQDFIDAMNRAIMMVQSGAFDYQTAIRRAIESIGGIGARVSYDTGGYISLEAAARMNILTSINQTAAKITIMNGERMGCEYYETSAHAGARLSHMEWQGQVFKIEGADQYPNFYDATGYGEVDGLCGVNCRHSFYPYFPGISQPAYSDEKLEEYANHRVEYNGTWYSDYEASQIQRRYERAIRDSKRIIGGYDAAIDEASDEETRRALEEGKAHAKQTYNARRQRLTDFCKQTGRKKDYIRHKVE